MTTTVHYSQITLPAKGSSTPLIKITETVKVRVSTTKGLLTVVEEWQEQRQWSISNATSEMSRANVA